MAGPFLPLSKSPLDFGVHAAKHRSVTKTCTVAPLATRCRSAPPLPRPVLFQPPSTPLPVGALLHHSTTTSTAYIRSLRATHYSKGRTHPSPCWPPPSAPPALRGLARRGGSCGAPPSPAAASFLPALIKHQTTTLSRSPQKAFGPSLPRRAPLLLLFSSTRVGTRATQRLLLILLFFALLFCSLPAVWSPSCPALPSRCCPPDASRPFFLTPSFPQSFKRNPPCLPAFQILLFFCHPPYHQQPLQQTHNNTHNNTQQTRYYTSHLHKHYQTASPPFPPKSPGPHAPPATTTIVIITDGQCLTLGEFP